MDTFLSRCKTKLDDYGTRIKGLEVEMNTNVVKKMVYEADKSKNEEKFSQIIQDANGLSSIVAKKLKRSS